MLDSGAIAAIVSFVLPGIGITLSVTAVAAALALVVSIGVGAARLSNSIVLRLPATIYVEVGRGSSLLVQIFYFYYVLPLLGVPLTPFWAGTLALAMNGSAYGSEVVRGALLAVDRGQHDAVVALNFSRLHAFRRIILPQAARRMILPFGNILIDMLKSTPLLSLISLTDLLYRGQMFITMTGKTTETFTVLLGIYLLIGWPLLRGIEAINRRFARGGSNVI